MMRKLVREGLSQSFTKCLEDHAVLNWHQGTQQEILLSCLALVDLAVAKLEVRCLMSPQAPGKNLVT